MVILLFWLCIRPVFSIFDETCPRKDPPPGVLVVSPGNTLFLTCSGQVKVNGVKVVLTGSDTSNRKPVSVGTPSTKTVPHNNAVSSKNGQTSLPVAVIGRNFSPTSETGIMSDQEENRYFRYTVSPHTVHPTSASGATTDESDWQYEDVDNHGDYEDDENGEEESRVTRGVKLKHQWKKNNQLVQRGDRNWEEILFMNHDSAMSLASVRESDAGKYSCHFRDKEVFAVKVLVADPPETPSLTCIKKSPESKIRCEWRPRKPVPKLPSCYLLLRKGHSEKFHKIPCSYSPQQSRCWCVLEHNEDERRTLHLAFLCVTSIVGNATSPLLYFNPLGILKPNPPSNVLTHQVKGQERKIKVTWNLPLSWNPQNDFYDILYEIKYRPLTSVNEQVFRIKQKRSFTISDALPGVQYLIQLRTKEEYDGHWSEWSSPVNATSWIAQVVATTPVDLQTSENIDPDLLDDNYTDGPENANSNIQYKMPHHGLWISGLFVILLVILAVYIFRHKDKLKSKVYKLRVITQHSDSSPPSPPTPAAPEGEALVNFVPQLYKESDTQEGEENEEEQTVMDSPEAMSFNNTSYFFLQRES